MHLHVLQPDYKGSKSAQIPGTAGACVGFQAGLGMKKETSAIVSKGGQ